MNLIWFRYELLLWFVFGLVLIWFQLWFLMWVKNGILVQVEAFFTCAFGLLCTWLPCYRWGNANSSMVWAQLGKTQVHPHNRIKSYQNRIKTISKSYETKPPKPWRNWPWAVSASFFWSQPTGTKIKSKSYQNRIKTISKPYQDHVKTTKTLQKSTKSLSRGNHNPQFKAYQIHVSKSIISARYQYIYIYTHIKIIEQK